MAQLVPDEPITHYNLGLLYRLGGDHRTALQEFAIAARLDANFVTPRFQIFDVWREAENTAESTRALAEFQRVKKHQESADAPAEDINWSFYSEIYDPIEARPSSAALADLRFRDQTLAGTVDPATAEMLVVDADGDGTPDLLCRSGTQPAEGGLSGVRDVVSIAAGDYNNDGFPDLCIVTKTGASLYLNEKGVFHKDAHQPAVAAGAWSKAVWLDYDHDYDLDLLLIGEHPVLLRNQGPAGSWQTVIDDMGMPSGKTKTVAVDLSGKFLSASREVRIVTNLCIYWDEIFLAEDAGAPETRLTPLDASSADLHFRGYSRARIDPQLGQPEYFDYTQVSAVSQWNPTPGFYTRYGDVRELLARIDDRLVIMGSGDELRLRFDGISCCWWMAGPKIATPTPRILKLWNRCPSTLCRATRIRHPRPTRTTPRTKRIEKNGTRALRCA